ncbi:hypothetical protein BSZ21_10200 [Bradyrhizobium canariense]|uniref:hypothetical protein n=1 Tax=Bradyrhizobium canariense TaxID=255045 RepID=UPI000A18BA6C|nr:hypothetical protein [Bradyrhizobium canariense]OSI70973.1 hypothetical protein BSZ21_10200 [Bradyrhizobium canariense]
MLILRDLPRGDKPLSARDVKKCLLMFDFYADTVVWFLPVRRIDRVEFNRLRELYDGESPIKPRPSLSAMQIVVQSPQPELLTELAYLEEKYGGNTTRLDVSADVRPDPSISPELQLLFIKAHMLMLRRRAGPIGEYDNDHGIGALYVPTSGVENKPRDIAIYCDRVSKLKPEGPRVAHIDLRLQRRALRTPFRNREQGRERLGVIEHTHEILELDPSDLFRRHVCFVDFDVEQARRDLFRKIAQNVGTKEEAKRMIEHEKRFGQLDYVQRWHDRMPTLRLQTAPGLVQMPGTLTWGAVRRRRMEKRLG